MGSTSCTNMCQNFGRFFRHVIRRSCLETSDAHEVDEVSPGLKNKASNSSVKNNQIKHKNKRKYPAKTNALTHENIRYGTRLPLETGNKY